LTGATGMVGGLVLRQALDHPAVAEVTALGRRPTGLSHPDLTEVFHDDFGDFSHLPSNTPNPFAGQDIGIFCLGVYTGTVPDEELCRVTVDYAVAFAEALHAASPDAAVCFLSGQGADSTESSRIAFARYKGMAENALLALGFPRVHIFRPGYIYPVTPRTEPNLAYRLFRGLWPVVGRIAPGLGIASDDLARVMLHAGLHGTPGHDGPILENRDIRTLAEGLR
jgi:uncharacterized protein YbjT (DUF2867 family)